MTKYYASNIKSIETRDLQKHKIYKFSIKQIVPIERYCAGIVPQSMDVAHVTHLHVISDLFTPSYSVEIVKRNYN